MNKKEIMQALEIIQEVCKRNAHCDDCPLRGSERDGFTPCSIKNDIPENWALNNKKPWKAFEW